LTLRRSWIWRRLFRRISRILRRITITLLRRLLRVSLLGRIGRLILSRIRLSLRRIRLSLSRIRLILRRIRLILRRIRLILRRWLHGVNCLGLWLLNWRVERCA